MLTMMPSSYRGSEIPLPDFGDITESISLFSSESCSDSENLSPNFPEEQESTKPFLVLTPRQLAERINNPMSFGFEKIIILDARFEYEFHGGRIIGARNIRSKSQMIAVFDRYIGQNVCIVVHCEFSQNRGPTLLHLFREYDRHRNQYPKLSYPHVYLLEGGYRRFFEEMPHLCIGGYVPMREEKFVNSGELRRSHSLFAREMLQQKRPIRPKLSLVRCSSQSTDHWSTLFGQSVAASAPTSPSFTDTRFSYPLSQ